MTTDTELDSPPKIGGVAERDIDMEIVRALDDTWDAIKAAQPGVPDATWYLTSGPTSSCSAQIKRGVLTVFKINLMKDGKRNLTGRELLFDLLHLAAHGAGGPTRRMEGRYHTHEFAEAARNVGLATRAQDRLRDVVAGDMVTDMELARGTIGRFEPQVRAMDKAMRSWQPDVDQGARKSTRGPWSLRCDCHPPRVMRMSSGDSLLGQVRCEICGSKFRIVWDTLPDDRKASEVIDGHADVLVNRWTGETKRVPIWSPNDRASEE
jgi:hypothetical protein